jgi:chemotaxis protein MotB
MTARHHPDQSESGILVYPQLPVPDARRGEPRQARPRRRRIRGRWVLVVAIAMTAGGAAAWVAQPVIAPDPRIDASARRASDAAQAAEAQKRRADALEQALDTTASARRAADARLAVAEAAQAELARKVADAASHRHSVEAVHAKLRAALDKPSGTVTVVGDEVQLSIADRVLWKPHDDSLTDHGRAVLHKLAIALKDLPGHSVRVQGHTDDQPPPLAPPAAVRPGAAPTTTKKGAGSAPVAAAPAARFATNWELSAARALAVVHFFQDVARLDPTRLAALAFGQYAPVSSKDRTANRRLEIVVVVRRPPAN